MLGRFSHLINISGDEENLEVLRQQGKNVSRAMLKGLEKRKHNLEAKLAKVEHAIKSRTDDVVDFKQKTAYEISRSDWSSDGALPIWL